MEHINLSTNLLVQKLTDNEYIAIVKYQSLWAMLERQPEDKTALRYMTHKQLELAKLWQDSIRVSVSSEIDSINKRRTRQKKSYEKQKVGKDSDVVDKIREDVECENKEKSPHTPHKEIKINPKGFTKSFPEDFLNFWSVYPKQRAGSRDKAYSAYCRVLKEGRATSSELLASAQKYATSEEVAKGFAKGCAAWLNDDRFLVGYEAKQPENNPFHVEW